MRTTLTISLLSIALAAGGCKKKQDDTYDETAQGRGSTRADLDEAHGHLEAAKDDLRAAKEHYEATAKDRLAKLDAEIHELGQRADAKSKQAAADLEARRDRLATKLKSMQDRAADNWDAFTRDVDSSFDKLEQDAHDALK